MFNWLKNKFIKDEIKKPTQEDFYKNEHFKIADKLNSINLDSVTEPYIAIEDDVLGNREHDPSKKNVLIVDDTTDVSFIYQRYLNIIKRRTIKNPYMDFNIVSSIGNNCGLIAFKFLKDKPIDSAILDLTLGYLVRTGDSDYIVLDGVDIAIEIWKRYPTAKIIFWTANALNKTNMALNTYSKKFKYVTGKKLEDYYVSKGDTELHKKLYLLLYGDRYETKE